MPAKTAAEPAVATMSELKLSRALLSGLPTIEQVRETFQKISARDPLPFTERDQRTFQVDFYSDLRGLQQRLARLKLQISSNLLRGVRPAKDDHNKDPLCERLRELAYVSPQKTDLLNSKKQAELLGVYNHLVPEELRIPTTLRLGRTERQSMYDLTFSMQYAAPLSTGIHAALESLCREITKSAAKLTTIGRAPLLFAEGMSNSHESVLALVWDDFRSYVKQLAAIYERESWFSPAYQASTKMQRGFNQGSIEPFRSDYQRWKINGIDNLERQLKFSFYGERAYQEHLECTLTTSGMAGIKSILEFIDYDHNRYFSWGAKIRPMKVFSIGEKYFELKTTLDDFCNTRNLKPSNVAARDTDRVIARIKRDAPTIVLIEPLANTHDLRFFDLRKVLEALCERNWVDASRNRFFTKHGSCKREINLVIDNTMLGASADWKGFDFSRIPRFVRVFVVDSLVKLGQDGLDITSAGLVTTIGEYLDSEYKKHHRDSSLCIPEATFHKLSLIHSEERLSLKHARHHRNTVALARMLEATASPEGFITNVNHPSLPSHPDHEAYSKANSFAGAIVTVDFSQELLSRYERESTKNFEQALKERANGFLKLVIELAREANIDINVGSSFGFNHTRLAVYSYLGKKIDHLQPLVPYLRIAVGAENYKDLKIFAATISRANEIFSSAMKNGGINSLPDKILKSDFNFASLWRF